MHGVVRKPDKLIHCSSVGRVDKLAQSGGRVDELIHGVVGNELMHGVVGKADELIHSSVVGRIDNLIRMRCGKSK